MRSREIIARIIVERSIESKLEVALDGHVSRKEVHLEEKRT